jgi:3-keto-5-aminohexanoate cleavage enzyme
MPTPLIIEAAINGSFPAYRGSQIPVAPDAIARTALECLDAGAAIIHAHAHDHGLAPQEAADAYASAWRDVVAERPSTLWYPTIIAGSTVEDRYAHYRLIADQIPVYFAVVDPGCTNLGHPDNDGLPTGRPMLNSYDDIRFEMALCEELGLGPSLGIYEPGYLRTVLTYRRAGRLPQGSMVKFYFGGDWGLFGRGRGVTFGLPPTQKALAAYVEMVEGSGLPWSVSVWGGDLMQTPVARMAIELGGHIHVGLEEFYDPERKPTNVELISEIVALSQSIGRPIADCQTAAEILDLPRKAPLTS